MNDNQEYENFIYMSFDIIAAIAWKGYIEKGRGAVVCNHKEKKEISSPTFTPTGVKAFVCPFIFIPVKEFITWLPVFDTLNSYDPKIDIVLIVLDEHQATCHHITKPDMTPEQAYQKKSIVLGDFPGDRLN